MSHKDQIIHQLARNPSDVSLWGKFYDLFEPELRLITYSMVRRSRVIDVSEAEDIVQDVFVGFVKNFERLKRELRSFAHVRNYLIKSCRNRFLNRIHQSSVRHSAHELLFNRFSDISSGPFQNVFAKIENRRYVEQLLGKVDENCKGLVHSYLFENITLAEYARNKGMKLGTVYARWQRCLEEMRKIISAGNKEKSS